MWYVQWVTCEIVSRMGAGTSWTSVITVWLTDKQQRLQ